MNWNFLIPLGIIVVMSVLGYLMQMLKNSTQKQQAERERERSAARARAKDRQPTVRTANRDLDRYQRAIDAQRAKPAPSNIPVAAKVVAPKPTRKVRLADAPAPDFPASKSSSARTTTAPLIPGTFDEIPTATVVTTPKIAVVTKPVKAPAPPKSATTEPVNPVAVQLQALLQNPNSLAVAIMLHEVLGPPKCKRG